MSRRRSRYYHHCPLCRHRMVRLLEERDAGFATRVSYLCPSCGTRGTYLPIINGWGEGWSPDIRDDLCDRAVKCGLILKSGTLIRKGGSPCHAS